MSELKIKPQRTNYTGVVIKSLVGGVIVSGAIVSPNILKLLSLQMRKQDYDEKRFLRAVRHASEKGFLVFNETAEGVEIALSKSGKLRWQKLELEKPLKSKQWDGKWRIVLFDIPVQKRNEAYGFREGLKKLGFIQFQKSVWICPYPCTDEVSALRQLYDVKSATNLVVASEIENEDALKQKFNLS